MSGVFAGVTADPDVSAAVPEVADQFLPLPDAVDQCRLAPRADLLGDA